MYSGYFQVTERFGIVGVSQFSMQYVLLLKYLNPVASALHKSHKNINQWHRTLGRVSDLLTFLHGAFYANYYIQVGGVGQVFFQAVPILSMFGLLGIKLLSATAISAIR